MMGSVSRPAMGSTTRGAIARVGAARLIRRDGEAHVPLWITSPASSAVSVGVAAAAYELATAAAAVGYHPPRFQILL